MKQQVNMKLKRQVAERLKDIRTNAGLSQQQFADSIGISRVYYNLMESPELHTMPNQALVKQICKTYDIDENWFMTGKIKQPETNVDVVVNAEEIAILSEAMEKQTTEYVSLKAAELLKKDSISVHTYVSYFQFFSSLLNLMFSLLDKIKTYNTKNEVIPDELYDSYLKQIEELLNIQKSK